MTNTSKPRVSIIAAIGRNGELGKRGAEKLLWYIPEDFKHFKTITMGKPVIMGSATFESIGKPLPGRLNIVLSHLKDYVAAGCSVMHSLDEAIKLARDEDNETDEIFIIGGGFVYKQSMEQELVDRLYLTLINADFAEADIFFPDYSDYRILDKRSGSNARYSYDFLVLEKAC